MDIREGFVGVFLVLGFVIFIVGFLTGMLAIALIPVELDFTTLGYMVFIWGFMMGMITIALLLVIVKLTGQTRSS